MITTKRLLPTNCLQRLLVFLFLLLFLLPSTTPNTINDNRNHDNILSHLIDEFVPSQYSKLTFNCLNKLNHKYPPIPSYTPTTPTTSTPNQQPKLRFHIIMMINKAMKESLSSSNNHNNNQQKKFEIIQKMLSQFAVRNRYTLDIFDPTEIIESYGSFMYSYSPSYVDYLMINRGVIMLFKLRELYYKHYAVKSVGESPVDPWVVVIDADVLLTSTTATNTFEDIINNAKRHLGQCEMVGQLTSNSINAGFLFWHISSLTDKLMQQWIQLTYVSLIQDIRWQHEQGWLQQLYLLYLQKYYLPTAASANTPTTGGGQAARGGWGGQASQASQANQTSQRGGKEASPTSSRRQLKAPPNKNVRSRIGGQHRYATSQTSRLSRNKIEESLTTKSLPERYSATPSKREDDTVAAAVLPSVSNTFYCGNTFYSQDTSPLGLQPVVIRQRCFLRSLYLMQQLPSRRLHPSIGMHMCMISGLETLHNSSMEWTALPFFNTHDSSGYTNHFNQSFYFQMTHPLMSVTTEMIENHRGGASLQNILQALNNTALPKNPSKPLKRKKQKGISKAVGASSSNALYPRYQCGRIYLTFYHGKESHIRKPLLQLHEQQHLHNGSVVTQSIQAYEAISHNETCKQELLQSVQHYGQDITWQSEAWQQREAAFMKYLHPFL